MLEQKLQQELNRYKAINRYAKTMMVEQELPAAGVPELPAPTDPTAMPADDSALPAAPIDAPETGETEEVDVTELVNMTKNIKKDIESNKQEHGTVLQQMDSVFSKLDDLESKLSKMDEVIAKIDELGSKIQQMKPPTAVEKLEMRSLDSYPFNKKPNDFFSEKQAEMQASGKNEYVLTKDDIESYSKEEIARTFNPLEDNATQF